MRRIKTARSRPESPGGSTTLASMLDRLDRTSSLSATRKRDLRSSVSCMAELLGDPPGRIVLDLEDITTRLRTINPLSVGMSPKRLANIRSDFMAAAKVCGLKPLPARKKLSPEWQKLFLRLKGRRTHLGLSRLARYASARRITPREVNDEVIGAFIGAVRTGSLHRDVNALHRQVTKIWNEIAAVPGLGLKMVTVASFREPAKRIRWEDLPPALLRDIEKYLSWCGGSDPFARDSRPKPLAPKTLDLRRNQIRAAVTALVESGKKPRSIRSLSGLLTPGNLTAILRHRVAMVEGRENTFNHLLAAVLIQIAREWVKLDAPALSELKRIVRKVPPPPSGLTKKNKGFLRQFDDPATFRRLAELPERLWAEVRRDARPNFRTLAKAHAAMAMAILIYMPLRLQNLTDLIFGTHLFINTSAGAVSTLEMSSGEVKNRTELAFDIPPKVAKMLAEYRDRLAPKIIGHRPKCLFENVDGTHKGARAIATAIRTYAKKRAGIALSAHQFRHLSAKILLDAQPGSFETVRQLLGHKNEQTTVSAYAGIDSRRAARHHQRLIESALEPRLPRQARSRKSQYG